MRYCCNSTHDATARRSAGGARVTFVQATALIDSVVEQSMAPLDFWNLCQPRMLLGPTSLGLNPQC